MAFMTKNNMLKYSVRWKKEMAPATLHKVGLVREMVLSLSFTSTNIQSVYQQPLGRAATESRMSERRHLVRDLGASIFFYPSCPHYALKC